MIGNYNNLPTSLGAKRRNFVTTPPRLDDRTHGAGGLSTENVSKNISNRSADKHPLRGKCPMNAQTVEKRTGFDEISLSRIDDMMLGERS